MSDKADSDHEKEDENPLKYAKAYMNPNGEMQPLDFNPLTEDYQRRMEDRIDRFGIQSSQTLNKQNILSLFESLGVKPPANFFENNDFESTDIPTENDKENNIDDNNEDNDDNNGDIKKDYKEVNNDLNKIRYEVIHLHGVDEMSTTDIFTFFHDYPPKCVEWVDDSSCNVVYSDVLNACKAFLGKSKVNNEHGSEDVNGLKERNGKEDTDEEKENEDMDVDDSEQQKSEEPVKESWRLGGEYPKASKLMMRFARVKDRKKGGKACESKFYQKYGNPDEKLWTKNYNHKKNKKNQQNEDGVTESQDVIEDDDDKVSVDKNISEDIVSVDKYKKSTSVKDRLGSRSKPDIRVRLDRSRSLSKDRSRKEVRRNRSREGGSKSRERRNRSREGISRSKERRNMSRKGISRSRERRNRSSEGRSKSRERRNRSREGVSRSRERRKRSSEGRHRPREGRSRSKERKIRSQDRRDRRRIEDNYKPGMRSRNSRKEQDWSSSKMTSFDRHVKEELESRRMGGKSGGSSYLKRYHQHDDQRGSGEDDGEYNNSRFNNDDAYENKRGNKGSSVKSRLGEVKRARGSERISDAFERTNFKNEENHFEDEDKFGNSDIEKSPDYNKINEYEEINYDFTDDSTREHITNNNNTNKSSVFNRLGDRF